MSISNRNNKYKNIKYNDKNNTKSIYMNLDLVTLNILCTYVVSFNNNIKRGHLINIQNALNLADKTDVYENDEKLNKFKFIMSALDGRLNLNIRNIDILSKHISGGLMTDTIINPDNILNDGEIKWVNDMVTDAITHGFAMNDAKQYIDICTKMLSPDTDKSEVTEKFYELVKGSMSKFRKSTIDTDNEMMFTLQSDKLRDIITVFHDQLSNPSNILKTGMQGLNEMIGGGFVSCRLYLLFGLPGEGKSTTLLNLAYQLKKHNRNFKTKDVTKKPCIVLLTMENAVRETVERLFDISCNTGAEFISFTPDEILTKLEHDGELYLTDQSPIDIIIKYKPNRSVDTSYLYTLTDELEDMGYEVIALIQDYIKNIRSIENNQDTRIELGLVTNEFKNFATIKDIPVISASQLNRDATKHIDEARKTHKSDLVRLMGRSNIGESMLMLENADAAFLLAPEYDEEGLKYMGIQRIKIRYKASKREHIYQPFAVNNGIKYLEDINAMIPIYKETMRNDGIVASNISSYHTNTIKDIDSDIMFRIDNEHNSFINRIACSILTIPAVIKKNKY